MIHAWRRPRAPARRSARSRRATVRSRRRGRSRSRRTAARRSRVPRPRPSALRVAARWSAATATVSAPRRIARSAAASRSAAAGSSGASVAAARCQAARSKSPTTPASASCAARRSSAVARCWIADRTSGWRKRSEAPSTSMSRASIAGVSADAGTPAAATISETPSRSSSAAISTSHCVSLGRSSARASERTFKARVERKDVAEPLAGRGVIADRRRELGERQGVPGSFAQDPVPHRRSRVRARDSRPMSRASCSLQRLQRQLVDAGRIERRCLAFAKPDHHHERIGAEAASDESERIGGWAVEPLDVVGDHQDRAASGGIREQREGRQGDEERVFGRSLDQSERHTERRVLRLRQRLEPGEDRPEQKVKAGERQICLRPDTGRREHSHLRGPGQLDSPLQQRRLADPGVAADQERPAAGRRLGDEAGDDPQLLVPTEEPLAGDHRRMFARQARSPMPSTGPPQGRHPSRAHGWPPGAAIRSGWDRAIGRPGTAALPP